MKAASKAASKANCSPDPQNRKATSKARADLGMLKGSCEYISEP